MEGGNCSCAMIYGRRKLCCDLYATLQLSSCPIALLHTAAYFMAQCVEFITARGRERAQESERERESQLASQAKVLKFKCPKIPIPIPFFCVGQRPVCVSCHAYATCAATRQDSKIALGAHFLDQCS